VQGAVELAVAAAVQAVADDLSGGGGDRGGAGERGEGGLGAEAAAMRPRAEELGSADHTDARLGEQRGCELLHERLELRLQVGGLRLECEGAPRRRAERDDRRAMLDRLSGARAQAGAAGELLVGRQRPEVVAERFGCVDDQRLQLRDRLRAREDGTLTRCE
jgi:hypothetical protein